MIKHISLLKARKPRKDLEFSIATPEEAAVLRAADARERNTARMHPAEYTRLILRAKDGDLAPDEANRRILRFGGSTKLRKFPGPGV